MRLTAIRRLTYPLQDRWINGQMCKAIQHEVLIGDTWYKQFEDQEGNIILRRK